MNGQLSVRSKGHGRENAVEVKLPIAGARAVAVSQQIVEAITIQLATDQGFDHPPFRLTTFEEIRHCISGPWCVVLQ